VASRGRRRQPRDELGRFAKKLAEIETVARKSEAEKTAAKKPAARKSAAKKPAAKKFAAKKSVSRKPEAKKTAARKPVARKPVSRKPAARKPVARKPVSRKPAARKPVARKPAAKKPAAKKPATRKPAARKPAARKPAARKPAARKPVARKPVAKKPGKRKRKRRRPELPLLPERSRQAEILMQTRLVALFDGIAAEGAGLVMGVQTYVNADGTVDGELRIESLPDIWREAGAHTLIVEFLSHVFRYFEYFPSRPPMGGAFWVSFGVRFGPQNEAEVGEIEDLYKKHRGLFQIGTYPTQGWGGGAVQNALTDYKVGLRAMLESLMEKRGLPPTVLLVRFIWTPDGKRPAHYLGEKGET